MKLDRRLARKLYRITEQGDSDLLPDYGHWLSSVTFGAEGITLHPGRRATIKDWQFAGRTRDSTSAVMYTGVLVEVRWRRSKKLDLPVIVSITVEPPSGLSAFPIDDRFNLELGSYWAALVLRLKSEALPEGDIPRPAPGKRPPLEHYKRVRAEYDQLLREGHSNPIAIMAKRYGVKPNTVKSWKHRANRYLGEPKGKGES
jgi:hypothetical protein